MLRLILTSFILTSAVILILKYLKGPPPRVLTAAERDHLLLLGTTAGAPGIIHQAIKSGNIFDPAHMRLAEKMRKEWEEGMRILGSREEL